MTDITKESLLANLKKVYEEKKRKLKLSLAKASLGENCPCSDNPDDCVGCEDCGCDDIDETKNKDGAEPSELLKQRHKAERKAHALLKKEQFENQLLEGLFGEPGDNEDGSRKKTDTHKVETSVTVHTGGKDHKITRYFTSVAKAKDWLNKAKESGADINIDSIRNIKSNRKILTVNETEKDPSLKEAMINSPWSKKSTLRSLMNLPSYAKKKEDEKVTIVKKEIIHPDKKEDIDEADAFSRSKGLVTTTHSGKRHTLGYKPPENETPEEKEKRIKAQADMRARVKAFKNEEVVNEKNEYRPPIVSQQEYEKLSSQKKNSYIYKMLGHHKKEDLMKAHNLSKTEIDRRYNSGHYSANPNLYKKSIKENIGCEFRYKATKDGAYDEAEALKKEQAEKVKKAKVQLAPNKEIGHRIADIGPGGKEHNVQTKNWPHKEENIEEAIKVGDRVKIDKEWSEYDGKLGTVIPRKHPGTKLKVVLDGAYKKNHVFFNKSELKKITENYEFLPDDYIGEDAIDIFFDETTNEEYYVELDEETLAERRFIIRVNAKGKRRRLLKCPKGKVVKSVNGRKMCVNQGGAAKLKKRLAIRKAVRTKRSKGAGAVKRANIKRQRALRRRHAMGL